MSIAQADAAIRIAAIAIVLLLAGLMMRDRRRLGLPGALFPPLALCISGFVACNTPLAALRPSGLAGEVAHALSGFTVVFLWWFCLACFDSRFLLRGAVLGVGVIWVVLAALDRGLLGAEFAGLGLSYLLVPLGFGVVGHMVWRLLKERAGDLIEQRHDARTMVAVLLGGMLLIDLAADALFGLSWRPIAFSMTQNAMVLAFSLWLSGRLLSVRPEVLTFGAAPQGAMTIAPRTRDGAGDDLRRRLVALMDKERVFLDPSLNFAGFVAKMGASDRSVRTLIHHELGHDHFRTFLNHYRVAEARRLMADPQRADKLVAVALDSGFASLASFNRAFRLVEGCSPSQYRAVVRQAEPDGVFGSEPGSEQRNVRI